jgi:hypothetical protein
MSTPETEKPRAKRGLNCPLWRKDASKVCHTCMFWEPIPLKQMVDGQLRSFERWSCTILHGTFVMRDMLASLDGVQQSQESFRNTAWKESQKNLQDVIAVAQHQNAVNADVARRIRDGFARLAEAVGLAPPSEAPKLINGKHQQ